MQYSYWPTQTFFNNNNILPVQYYVPRKTIQTGLRVSPNPFLLYSTVNEILLFRPSQEIDIRRYREIGHFRRYLCDPLSVCFYGLFPHLFLHLVQCRQHSRRCGERKSPPSAATAAITGQVDMVDFADM